MHFYSGFGVVISLSMLHSLMERVSWGVCGWADEAFVH